MVFTSFGNILGAALIKRVDKSDGHFYFDKPRTDKDGKNKNHHFADKLHFDTEDDMSVSVQSLHIFLESLLHQATSNAYTRSSEMILDDFDDAKNRRPHLDHVGMAGRAASAYETQAKRANGEHSDIHVSTKDQQNIELNAHEIEKIETLLVDLDRFIVQGIEYLHLKKGPTLLDMLTGAIARQKAELGL